MGYFKLEVQGSDEFRFDIDIQLGKKDNMKVGSRVPAGSRHSICVILRLGVAG